MWLALKGAGIPILENESIDVGGVHVAGLADLRMRNPSMSTALREVPEGAPTIVLTHDPDLFPFVPEWVSLTSRATRTAGRSPSPTCAARWSRPPTASASCAAT